MKSRIIAVALLTMVTLVSCGRSVTDDSIEKTTENSIQYDKSSISTSANTAISTGEVDSNFVDGFTFLDSDIATVESDCRAYFFDGSYYIQTGDYMYRFQLNEKGLIESYLKYNIYA